MIARLLGLANVESIARARFIARAPWPAIGLAAVLAAGAILAALALYRRERNLTAPRRVLLGGLRCGLLGLTAFALCEPALVVETVMEVPRGVIVLLDASESMAVRDRRDDPEELIEAAMALGLAPVDEPVSDLSREIRDSVNEARRFDLAMAVLRHPDLGLHGRLAPDYRISYYAFGEDIDPLGTDPDGGPESAAPTARATAIGVALENAAARHGGRPVAAVLLLSDGASNLGIDPVEAAHRLGAAGIPVHTVGFGLPDPPDLWIEHLSVPEAVFPDDEAGVHVMARSRGLDGLTTDLVLKVDGRERDRKTIFLDGTGRFERLAFTPEEGGLHAIEVTAEPLARETTEANNTAHASVRVIDEKINVLYIEGRPRWEYRYLRQVLLRDPRLNVRFAVAEGDPDLARHDERYLARFPTEAARAFEFDLVILGDVDPGFFTREEMRTIVALVREQGGSFLMLAGDTYAPHAYLGTPLDEILPVEPHPVSRENIDPGVYPVVPEGVSQSPIVNLDDDPARNREIWRRVRPLHQLPRIENLKPGAVALLELSDGALSGRRYPLVAWQRYGNGRSMYVGSDQLWRLRFMTGDLYHGRFWSRTGRFLTMARLLGEDRRVSFRTDRAEYGAGETVRISARVLDETFEPAVLPYVAARIRPHATPRTEETVRLYAAGVDAPGLFEGAWRANREGVFEVLSETAAADASGAAFRVRDVSLEMSNPALQSETLRRISAASGGRHITVRQMRDLPEMIGGERRGVLERTETDLWDTPLLLAAILALAGIEWALRRAFNLV